jgi:membrane-bound serine protease (ClpP class)
MEILSVLLVAGFALVVLECFLPGMIAGIAGAVCLIAAVGYAYATMGVAAGSWTLIGVLVGSLAVVLAWMKWFPRFGMGKRMVLDSEISGSTPDPSLPSLAGMEGEAVTPLRPAGVARIGGVRRDVVTEGSLIDAGTRVTVVQVEGMRVVVRASERMTQ